MLSLRIVPVLLVVIGFFLITRGDEPRTGAVRLPAALPAAESKPAPAATAYRGSGSCSATACHGSIQANPGATHVLRNEHTTWLSNDAHARAFEVLYDPRSANIERNLAGESTSFTPAYRDERCLACHATPRSIQELQSTHWLDPDGVGCEACHGASKDWIGPHTTLDWQALTATEKAHRGMRETKDLTSRARLCVGCHVGSDAGPGAGPRDVNHDLIAAGHPRLAFELSAYLANMPPHWLEKQPNADPVEAAIPAADFPVRAWALGRLVQLQASLDLTRTRAQAAANKIAIWPEFSEYSCFSCHHELRDQPSRRKPDPTSLNPGAPGWIIATLAPDLDHIATLSGNSLSKAELDQFRQLTEAMQSLNVAPTSIVAQLEQVSQAAAHLLSRLSNRRFERGDIKRLIAQIDTPETWSKIRTWDQAALHYLTLVPLYQTWCRLAPEEQGRQAMLKDRLEALMRALAFPDPLESPAGFDPAQLPIPRSTKVDQVRPQPDGVGADRVESATGEMGLSVDFQREARGVVN